MHIFGPMWENILVGLLSSALVALITFSHRHLKNKLLEKKFPMAGHYITKFADESNGEKVFFSAPATLSQKGNKIYGKTNISGDEREWLLEGEISKQGYLYGFYYAVDPHDKGIGNFFLKINYNRQMNGLWAGFDSVNNKITSGEYAFIPAVSTFTLRSLLEKDFSKIVAISEQQLGRDYLNVTDLEKSLSQPDIYFTRVIEHQSRGIMGFSLSKIMSGSSIKEYIHLTENEYPKALMCAKNIGLLGIIAVENEFQGRGLGTALIKDTIKEFSKREINTIWSTAWRSSKGVNIGGILGKSGFQILKEIPDYWKEDSIKRGYHCPDCGPPPCKCSAVVYGKF